MLANLHHRESFLPVSAAPARTQHPQHRPGSAAVPQTWTDLSSHPLQESRCCCGALPAAPFQGLVQQLAGAQGCHGSAAIARAASAQPSSARPAPSPVPRAGCSRQFSSICPGTPGAAATGGAVLPHLPQPNTHLPLRSSHLSPKLGAQIKPWDPGVTSQHWARVSPPNQLSLGRFVVFFSSLQGEQCQCPTLLAMPFRQGCCSYPVPSHTRARRAAGAHPGAALVTQHSTSAGLVLQLLTILLAEDSGFGTSVPPECLFLRQSACRKAPMILTTTGSLQTDISCAHISGLPNTLLKPLSTLQEPNLRHLNYSSACCVTASAVSWRHSIYSNG